VDTGGGWDVSFGIDQYQDSPVLFSLPVPLRFSGPASDTLVAVTIDALQSQRVWVRSLEFRPEIMEFDPNGSVLAIAYENVIRVGSDSVPFLITAVWPNPGDGEIRCHIRLFRALNLTVSVYNMMGQRVNVLHDGFISTSTVSSVWQPSPDISSGVFFIRARGTGHQQVVRVVRLK
jgi:hypothetical protein